MLLSVKLNILLTLPFFSTRFFDLTGLKLMRVQVNPSKLFRILLHLLIDVIVRSFETSGWEEEPAVIDNPYLELCTPLSVKTNKIV
ncbi:Hypothetical predicted protein [Octopus vulgaris]|uniref:Uncharacterized protein n=1 Tax=Octopus vulgaris TaxID=6645 RepID=A0AA36AF73_OCTVU|nr:Hypothetical predicted protein [Octopus vulgaris]